MRARVIVSWQQLFVRLLCCIAFLSIPIYASDLIPPVTAEELAMKSEPLAPGAPAIILYRLVQRDDNGRTSHEDNFVRIKIFNEEGLK